MMSYAKVKSIVAAQVAVFAFGCAAATVAHAEEAPLWSVEGARLAAGETREITAKAYKTKTHSGFTLTVGSKKISCSTIKLKEGAISGSSAGNPGTDREVIELSGSCTVEGNGDECKVKEPIVSSAISSELVESEKGEKESLLMEFKPVSGTKFMPLLFEGSKCTIKEAIVEGEIASEMLVDPNSEELGAKITQSNEPDETKSVLVNFPSMAIAKVWLVKEEKGSEVSVKELLTSGTKEAVKLEGTALVALASGEEFGEGKGPRIRATKIKGRAGAANKTCIFKEAADRCVVRVENTVGKNIEIFGEFLFTINGMGGLGIEPAFEQVDPGANLEGATECEPTVILKINTSCSLEFRYIGPANPANGQYSSRYEVDGKEGAVRTNSERVRLETVA
jgi:hypothetical protein